MEAFRKYFTGPVLLSSITGALICALAFLGRDTSESMLIPLLTFICGLTTLGAGVWGGVKSIGDKTNVYRAIGPKTQHIISFSSEQFTSMALAAKEMTLHSEKKPSDEQIRTVLSKLNPRGSSPSGSVQTGRMLNWMEYMYQYSYRTRELVNFIYQFMPFLDSELVRILGELEDCYHFKEIELLANGPGPGNKDLEFVAGAFRQYQGIVSELSDYFDKNLKAYSKNTPAMAVQPIIK